MLNNPGKIPNATINRWVDYIRTNFFFELVHKKGKTFGPDGLSRRKWYPGDTMPEGFKDGSEDGGGDIIVRKEGQTGDDLLTLEEFYDEIDSREGFYHGIMKDDSLMQLGRLEIKVIKRSERLRAAFTEAVKPRGDEHNEDAEDSSEEEELGIYDNNRCSDHAKYQEEMLFKVKRYLMTRDLSEIGVMTADQARFVRQASHYWLDRKDGKLYRKNAGGGNPQLVIEISERMRLLRECHDKIGHRGAYATGRMLQQRFWWPEIEEDAIWYVKSCHLCQIKQRMALETPPVVTHTPSIFQVLYADTVHMTPPSNGCRYIVHSRCGLSS